MKILEFLQGKALDWGWNCQTENKHCWENLPLPKVGVGFWILLIIVVIVGCCLYVFFVIFCHRKHRASLLQLLGSRFAKNRRLVQVDMAIAVDEKERRFAFTNWEKAVVCSANEITDLRFEAKGSNDETKSAARLIIGTTNKEHPILTIKSSSSQRLDEMYSQLRAVHEWPEPSINPPALAAAAPAGLEDAIGKLTAAVLLLCDAVKELSERECLSIDAPQGKNERKIS